jgi:hypothetical protein
MCYASIKKPRKPKLELLFAFCRLQKIGLNVIHNFGHIQHRIESIIESHYQISPNFNCSSNSTPHLHHFLDVLYVFVPHFLCTYVWVCLCFYVCQYVHVCLWMSMSPCVFVCVCVGIFVSMRFCVSVCWFVLVCLCMSMCLCGSMCQCVSVCLWVMNIISIHLCIYKALSSCLSVHVIYYHYTFACESYLCVSCGCAICPCLLHFSICVYNSLCPCTSSYISLPYTFLSHIFSTCVKQCQKYLH